MSLDKDNPLIIFSIALAISLLITTVVKDSINYEERAKLNIQEFKAIDEMPAKRKEKEEAEKEFAEFTFMVSIVGILLGLFLGKLKEIDWIGLGIMIGSVLRLSITVTSSYRHLSSVPLIGASTLALILGAHMLGKKN